MSQEWGADTFADSIASQVRSHPPLDEMETAQRLRSAHLGGQADIEVLTEHNLDIAFASALARPSDEIDFGDLYQEGTMAVLVAVNEFAAREGEAAHLRDFIRKVVDTHLDEVIEERRQEREADEALVSDVQTLETAQIELRKELGRPATFEELAAKLAWEMERVELVDQILAEARELYDQEIAQYLDEVDEEEDLESDAE